MITTGYFLHGIFDIYDWKEKALTKQPLNLLHSIINSNLKQSSKHQTESSFIMFMWNKLHTPVIYLIAKIKVLEHVKHILLTTILLFIKSFITDANFSNIIVQFHFITHISQQHNKKKTENKLYTRAAKDINVIQTEKKY